MTATMEELAVLYRRALLQDVIPFWERYSVDWEQGGYFTCLDGAGNVFDTDKFVWLQARQVWTFSMLYNRVDKRDTWQRFPDPAYGEWFGYLNRRGEVLLNLKGGKWKGCFHVPRALYLCSQEFHHMSHQKRKTE